MSVEGKDQEMSEFEKLVSNKQFKDAYQWLSKSTNGQHNKNFNLAYLKYHEGKLPEARALLEHLKFKGFISNEVTDAIHVIKRDLDLIQVESEYTPEDDFIITSSSLPGLFYPSLSVMFLFFTLLFAHRKNYITMTLSLLFTTYSTIAYLKVKSFQVEINPQEVTIYKGPSKIFEEVYVLPEGAQLITTKTSKDWHYIEYPSIYRGWIRKDKAIK